MNPSTIVFNLPGNEALGNELASSLQSPQGSLFVHQFPDGETYVRAETPCKDLDVVLTANLYQPNALLLPLSFCAQAVRVLGARRVILVSPYLPYMRQDARFKPGEVVTSRIFAKLLSEAVDGLVTVDPHLHRYTSLDDLYSIPSSVQHAAPAIARWIRANITNALIVGPDQESEQWVKEVAQMADAEFIVLSKTRHGDRNVSITVPPLDQWRGCTPVLVDDIISTARTMIETVEHLLHAGYAPPVCIGVHGVFAADAYKQLKDAGVADIVTCNTVPHSSNLIDLVEVLASGVRTVLEMRSTHV